jgi:uncharacterized membrane protein
VIPVRASDQRSRVAIAAWLLAALLTTTGVWHFASPHGFESIVPRGLGSPPFWVYLSGVGELVCAVGLATAPVRRLAGWATVAGFVVVFPANITMAVHAAQGHGSELIAFGRLPLQIPLVLWALYIALRAEPFTRGGRRDPAPARPGPPAPR